jgi:hypothetical protein
MILQHNPVAAMLTAVVLLGTVLGLYVILLVSIPAHLVALGLLVYFVGVILLGPFTFGLYSVFAANSASARTVSMGETTRLALRKLFPMWGLLIIEYFAVVGGLMLLVVPGLIFLGRSALAPIYMFDEGLGVMKAIEKSLNVTKGHTVEMLGAIFAGMLMGGGYLLGPAVLMAPLVGRYNELRGFDPAQHIKPKTHWLNWFAVITSVVLIIVFFVLYIVLIAVSVQQGIQDAKNHPAGQEQALEPTTSPSPSASASPLSDAAVIVPAEQVAIPWLTDVQQGKTAAAYALEDPTYQHNYPQAQQRLDTAPMQAPHAVNSLDSHTSGEHGNAEMAALVYKTSDAQGRTYWVQIDVQQDGSDWKVWGYTTSWTAITPTIPN